MEVALAQAAASRDGVWSVPDGWQQGRGAWGGLVVAALVRAAVTAENSSGVAGRPVRSVSAEIVAPVVAGLATIDVREVRRGSSTATWAVEVTSDGQLAVTASVVLGDDRRGVSLGEPTPPAPPVPPWSEVAEVDLAPPLAPPFLQHLRMRPLRGFPYSGSTDDVVAWIGYPSGSFDAAALLALVDGPWPVALVRTREQRPMATLSFLATLLVDPSTVDPSEPLLFASHLIGEHAGYATERRELWTADGRLVVENLQLITLIR